MPNDNRVAAGRERDGVREIVLEARLARWTPDSAVDTAMTVQAFADRDGVPRVPGPLVRVARGTEVRVTVINSIPDSTLVLHGIQGSAGTDSVVVPSGERREIQYTAGAPGTYLYWATTSGKAFSDRLGRDGQLTGAIVVDDPTVPRDTSERVFVITTLDILPDTALPESARDDLFDQAINGRSWPYTETIRATAGDTLRWRWLNGGYLPHPMHLHGFHYRVMAKGSGSVDTLYAEGSQPHVVTEFARSGSTFRMEFIPTRAGRWLFHCHMAAHIVPFPERPDSVRAHEPHDAAEHPRQAMSGLVMGIDVSPHPGAAVAALPPVASRQRIHAQEVRDDSGRIARRGFVLQRGTPPRADSVEVPGSLLILRRGQRTEITVMNRLSQPTSVHWHGMELDPYFDGVAGWSGEGVRSSPMIAPGDSFTVSFTPPRAGTFIYHSHLEEEPQLHYGMFGAMIVLEPGVRYEPSTDLLFVLGDVARGTGPALTVNGLREPPAMTLRAGTTYRLRIINILATEPVSVSLQQDTTALDWTPIAKDGADLPRARQLPRPARLLSGVGETFDFRWQAGRRRDVQLLVRPAIGGPDTLRVPIRVRP